MILLQSRFDTPFVSTANTNTIIIAGIIIGAFIIILIIVAAASNRKQSSGSSSRRSGTTKGSFRRRARQLGLNKDHIRTLEYVQARFKVKNPMELLSNARQLDFYLNKAIRQIDEQGATEEVKEARKLTLYRIKQVIERNVQKSGTFSSTKQLRAGQQLTVSGNGVEQRYQSHIVALTKDGIAVEVPYGSSGDQVRWRKWSPVVVFFAKSNGEGFSFESKVTGYNSFKGVPSLFIQHSGKIEPAKQRRYRRKEIEAPCYVYPVRVVTLGKGRNMQKKAYVEKNRASLGTIIEVSAGGCSLRVTGGIATASLVKVEFETERARSISSYGKIVNMHDDDYSGKTLHIRFTRVSKKNLNHINSYIYDYGEPT